MGPCSTCLQFTLKILLSHKANGRKPNKIFVFSWWWRQYQMIYKNIPSFMLVSLFCFCLVWQPVGWSHPAFSYECSFKGYKAFSSSYPFVSPLLPSTGSGCCQRAPVRMHIWSCYSLAWDPSAAPIVPKTNPWPSVVELPRLSSLRFSRPLLPLGHVHCVLLNVFLPKGQLVQRKMFFLQGNLLCWFFLSVYLF